MTRWSAARLGPGIVLWVVATLAFAGLAVPAASGASAASPPPAVNLTGSVHGPSVVALSGSGSYFLNASGGPAVLPNGTVAGTIQYFASLTGSNLTGVSFFPANGTIRPGGLTAKLTVNNQSQSLVLHLLIASTYQTQNQSINLTYSITVVRPYVLTATVVAGSQTILSFAATVSLDGTPVGSVTIPTLTPHQTYALTFQYPTLGLSPGWHTFTISVADAHGLVQFAGGGQTYSQSFYIPPAPANYTIWYIAGIAAFFGAIFIFVARVGARRRNRRK
ncbi:MAG: hypothetical protein ACYCPN_04175 [Thermoplasmata archaeon]